MGREIREYRRDLKYVWEINITGVVDILYLGGEEGREEEGIVVDI